MIKLVVDDYCKNGCLHFEAHVEKTEYFNLPYGMQCATEIYCKHAKACADKMRYLESVRDRRE